MIHNLRLRLTPHDASSEVYTRDRAAQKLGISTNDITALRIMRRSIDARKSQIMIDVNIDVYVNEEPK
jgi:uncharacterized FAD-dependent dehydrogenase